MTKQKKDQPQQALTNERTPHLLLTGEGAFAFSIDDPLVQLVFTFGSFLPGNETYYGTPEDMLRRFLDAVEQAGSAHPLLALQYAAWMRDPRQGKGNRSQPAWALAGLAKVPACLEHPRFAELVAKCIVRPDDALAIVQAATIWLSPHPLPPALKKGVALGLNQMSDYQLTKYANTSLNLLPEKVEDWHERPAVLPNPVISDDLHTKVMNNLQLSPVEEQDLEQLTNPHKQKPKIPQKSLRLVDVLGICKQELSPRLFALYRYLHAPTRQQRELLPILKEHLPLLEQQKELRSQPPRTIQEVEPWFQKALAARMTREQILSCTGMPAGQRKQLLRLKAGKEEQNSSTTDLQPSPPTIQQLDALNQAKVEQQTIQAELWRHMVAARISDEEDSQKQIPFLGDITFLRNVRAMYQSNISISLLQEEANHRQFTGIWPFQLLSASRQIEKGSHRGSYSSTACPQVIPVIETIFERIALTALPRKANGEHYHMLGLADTSSSMTVRLGTKQSKATCMDAAVAFSVAMSYTTRTEHFGGLAGTWDNTFHPVVTQVQDRPWQILSKVQASGGMGGTQIFGSILSLIHWLQQHTNAPRPEVLVILSDMQFHPAAKLDAYSQRMIPDHYKQMMKHARFNTIPPLAAAIVLYREILQQEVSVVIWNLAAYEGSPAPSNMERVLLMSGFDSNSLRIIEQWLRASSPGTAMPVSSAQPAGTGESGSSFEAILAALNHY